MLKLYYSLNDTLLARSLEPVVTESVCLKKNLNAPRPSEHPPVRGEKMSKRLGGINS